MAPEPTLSETNVLRASTRLTRDTIKVSIGERRINIHIYHQQAKVPGHPGGNIFIFVDLAINLTPRGPDLVWWRPGLWGK